MSIEYLVTHSGKFHADEVFSTVILKELFPDAEVIRTRDMDLVGKVRDRAITYDVGGCYSTQTRIFDHHQVPGPEREDGVPYSSFGLVWKHFGREFLAKINCDPDFIEQVWEDFDQCFVLPVDALDNGVIAPAGIGITRSLSLSEVINDMNPPYYAQDEQNETELFHEAAEIALTAVMARLEHMNADLMAKRLVEVAIREQWGRQVLVLEEGLPYNAAITDQKADHILYVVHPRSDGDWLLAGVPVVPGEYALRRDLPEDWAGLMDGDLCAKTGVNDAVFCHAKKFLAVARSRNGALRMADLALEGLHEAEPV